MFKRFPLKMKLMGLGGFLLLGHTLHQHRDAFFCAFEKKVIPQSAVLSPLTNYAVFTTIYLQQVDAEALSKAMPIISKQIQAQPQLKVSIGFSPALWKCICDHKSLETPFGTREYRPRTSKKGEMPHLGGEIFLHIKSDTGIEEARHLEAQLLSHFPAERVLSYQSSAEVQDMQISGFKMNMDNCGLKEKTRIALMQTEDENCGGSFLLFQVWRNKAQFLEKDPKALEKKMGFEAKTGRKLDLWKIYKRSHGARVLIFDKNTQEQITCVRQSMPLNGNEGKLFVGYAKHAGNFDLLLDRMVGQVGQSDEYVDYVFDFSTCEGGQYYYVPSLSLIQSI